MNKCMINMFDFCVKFNLSRVVSVIYLETVIKIKPALHVSSLKLASFTVVLEYSSVLARLCLGRLFSF